MKVPFVDMPRNLAVCRQDLHRAACAVIDSAQFIGGPQVASFEKEMARWLGVPEVCGVACCTGGLYILLRALGIGPGDEVITSVHTAIPTSEAITMTGARVVFADIESDPGRYNLDPADVARRITPRTRALIPVHLYGHPADLEAILELGHRHGLPVIEDCAQAQGARWDEKKVGTFGDAAAFSFFPSKNLGGFGDGGAITARDPQLLKRVRMIANHGRVDKYLHEMEGLNSRLDAMQAALLRVVLPHLDQWNEARHTAAGWYHEALQDVPGVILPQQDARAYHVYHVFVVQVDDRKACADHLAQQGIQSGVHYPMALNCQPAYAHLGQPRGTFVHAEKACDHMLSLPMFPTITRAEVQHVCDHLRTYALSRS